MPSVEKEQDTYKGYSQVAKFKQGEKILKATRSKKPRFSQVVGTLMSKVCSLIINNVFSFQVLDLMKKKFQRFYRNKFANSNEPRGSLGGQNYDTTVLEMVSLLLFETLEHLPHTHTYLDLVILSS